jgi:bacterial/archaeal transporter family-2 protein
MVLGLVLAVIAGCLVGLQNIFNSKVSERAGSWTTTTLVLGMGFFASLAFGLLFEGQNLFALHGMRPWYWVSGLTGIGVVVSIVQAIRLLGPTYAVSIVVTSQLVFALLWDSLGWLGLTRVELTWKQVAGVLIIILGVAVFKLGGMRQSSVVE